MCTDPRFRDSSFVNWHSLIGKTIKAVDLTLGANVVVLGFTDGTSMVVDTEPIGHGLYTPVLVDFVDSLLDLTPLIQEKP